MNTQTFTLPKIFLLFAVLTVLTAGRPQATIGEIRMCAAEVEVLTCPTDNPVFQTATSGIYISVDAKELALGDQVRFTWYYLPKDDFFSEYLGSVKASVSAANTKGNLANITSTFPKGVPVKPGNYEVVVHPPDGARPIVKSFKVLD